MRKWFIKVVHDSHMEKQIPERLHKEEMTKIGTYVPSGKWRREVLGWELRIGLFLGRISEIDMEYVAFRVILRE